MRWRSPLTAARMCEHAGDDAVGAAAVLGDLAEIAGQCGDELVDVGAHIGAERCHCGGRRLLQFVEQLDRQTGKVVDEIQRVLDLVRDPGGELAECHHLLRLHQARLRRPQFARCPLGRVPRRPDFLLRALSLGDVAVDHHKPAPRHWVVPHLDHAPVGPRPLESSSGWRRSR